MSPSEIVAAFRELDLHPSKALGQNFLHDANMARALAAVLQPAIAAGDRIVEIGPGLGSLTAPLLDAGARVVAIEKDRRLAEWLRRRFPAAIAAGALEVFRADALDFDARELLPGGPFALAGNLPYNVSTPLLFKWTAPWLPVTHALLTLQLELARRLAASPSTRDYGELSIVLQRRFHIRFLRKLPPAVFIPRPGVDSGSVLLAARSPESLLPCDETALRRLLAAGFGQRRKQMRKAMEREGLAWAEVADALNIAHQTRAEDVGVEDWIALARRLSPPGAAQSGFEELFDVVDECDRPIGRASRDEVHARGLRHRSVHILVWNGAGEVWLQRRSFLKDRYPGRWDSSAAGHLDAGESYDAAARRELREELGVDAPCEFVARLEASPQTGGEFVTVWQARHDGPFQCPPAEIDCGAFFPPNTIARWIAARPQDFAPGFLAAWSVGQTGAGEVVTPQPRCATARTMDS